MDGPIEFGVRIPDVFKIGFVGYFKNFIPMTLAGAVTLGVWGVFRYEAAQFLDDGADFRSLMVDLAGLVVGSTISYPWFSYALAAARGEDLDFRDPFYTLNRFAYQAVAGAYFWAGVLFGVRYGAGILFLPAILVAVLYGFHGYVVADVQPKPRKNQTRGGTYALGTSIRLGEKRRFGLTAIGILFLMFNFIGAMFGLAVEDQPALQMIVIVAGLIITASITLVGGAHIYDVLKEKLND